jgi:hypothetical protein
MIQNMANNAGESSKKRSVICLSYAHLKQLSCI